jgi:repressor LexA
MATTDLTEREREVLDFIVSRARTKGAPPTIREIGLAFRIASTNGVRYYLSSLERKGYITRNRRLSRGIEIVGGAHAAHVNAVLVPIVGRVAAGYPILAAENIEDTLVLDRSVARDGTVFALSVVGDSMRDAGILAGDKVIVRQQATASPGDIVVALIGDEATVKHYRPEHNRIVLEPANPSYEPIVVHADGDAPFSLVGKVVGVVRLYH